MQSFEWKYLCIYIGLVKTPLDAILVIYYSLEFKLLFIFGIKTIAYLLFFLIFHLFRLKMQVWKLTKDELTTIIRNLCFIFAFTELELLFARAKKIELAYFIFGQSQVFVHLLLQDSLSKQIYKDSVGIAVASYNLVRFTT